MSRQPGLDRVAAAALAVGYVALLLGTAGTLGYARDEGFYFHAASAYRRWFELLLSDPALALERTSIDRYFVVNSEHPVLMKLAFMLSHKVFFEELGVFREAGTAYRFPSMLVSGLGVALVYWWGARAIGRGAGLVAALSFALMPRVFYHAHLAAFDMPVASLWLLTAFVYMRSLESGRLRWALATGVVYGLLLDTKHNAWFFPIAACAHFALLRAGAFGGLFHGRAFRVPLGLIALFVLGPLVFYAAWPWIWFDTLERLQNYARFHTGHEYYNMEFLGRTYWKPPMPRAYAWVMTLATVPLVTLTAAGIGLGSSAVRAFRVTRARGFFPTAGHALSGRLSTDLLWLLGVLVNYAAWWSTDTPIFGGTKHWITAYPFLCLFAGRGFDALCNTALPRSLSAGSSRVIPFTVGAAVTLGPAVMTLHAHPWALSFYTPLVGGASGAANLGLNRTFWGYTTGAVTEFLNANARPGAVVYLHDTAGPSWEMLRRDGRVRADLRGSLAIHASHLALYHHEPHMRRVEYQIWMNYGTAVPAHVGTYDGVPVIWIYERP